MAAFETLLHRYSSQPIIGEPIQLLNAFAKRQEPPLERAWYCWAEAQRALDARVPQLALAWLQTGGDLEQKLEDPVLSAEYATTEVRCWQVLDEPKLAAGPARRAWELWSSLAGTPRQADVIASARTLLAVLSQPHPAPRMDEAEVYAGWMLDRLGLCYLAAAQQMMQIYGDHHRPDAAKKVCDGFLDWVKRNLSRGPAAKLSGLLAARLLTSLGDVQDRSGDSKAALKTFQQGLKHLEELPDIEEINGLRGQLLFNAANQLGKLGRLRDSQAQFEASNAILREMGREEAVLRGRYAICVTRFKLQDTDGLEDELARLAAAYEKTVAATAGGAAIIAARQGLDRVYRLWLRLTAERLDRDDAGQLLFLLHLLFAVKEEEGKFGEFLRVARRRRDGDIVSEVTVLLERAGERPDLGVLVIESAVDALVIVSVAPGAAPWRDRVAVQLVCEAAEVKAVADLMLAHHDVMERLGNHSLSAQSLPDSDFLAACRAAWEMFEAPAQRHIAASRTLMVCLGSQSDLDQFPVELLHDGDGFVGLTRDVLRVPTLNDLNELLCENRTNARPTGTAMVLRAEDNLKRADEEADLVVASLKELGIAAQVRRSPSVGEVLDDLGAGVDVLHYVGHGLADKIGEALPLGPQARLAARDLASLHPAPAPIAILSACLVARSRQLRSGHEQGFATQLLRRGSPAVIAALHRVPDRLTVEFAELLYFFLSQAEVPAALRAARQALADNNLHPAAWACFVIFGRPGVRLAGPHAQAATTWTSAALRYLTTRSEDDLKLTRRLLAEDARLSKNARSSVARHLNKLAAGDAAHFRPKKRARKTALDAFPQASMAVELIRIFGVIRLGGVADKEEGAQNARSGIAQAFVASRILGDTYVLIAAAVELCARSLHFFGEGRAELLRARRRLSWLSSEGAKLDDARKVFGPEED